jgi:hypothetical protein
MAGFFEHGVLVVSMIAGNFLIAEHCHLLIEEPMPWSCMNLIFLSCFIYRLKL